MDLSSESFRLLVERASDTVLLLDADGAVVYANPATEALFGRPPGDLHGELFGHVVAREQPTEIQILNPVRGAVTADVRSMRTSLTGQPYNVVYLRDVTERKQAEERLRWSEAQLRERVKELDCVSRVAQILLQSNLPLNELLQAVADTLPPGWQYPDVAVARISLGGREYVSEGFVETAWRQSHDIAGGGMGDGTVEVFYTEERPAADEGPFLDEERELLGLVALKVGQALERRQAETVLLKINRALRVLGTGNSELIRADDETELLAAICRVCVEAGGYRMAWVGFAEQDEARGVRPVAHAGFEENYLSSTMFTWGDDEWGQGIVGRAIRSGEPQVSRYFLTDPRMAPWRDEARQRGYQSSIALPVKNSASAFGVLVIYANEADAFDSEELRLLKELADDLAFGIVTLRDRGRHRLAEERIAYLAYFDELTGLPNRNRLMEGLAQAVGKLADGGELAVMTLNVARFGEIQAGIGVRQADELLRQLAARVTGSLGEGEMLAHIGGDEFAVLLSNGGVDRARDCVSRIERALMAPFQQAGIPISIQVRTGIAVAPDHGREPEALLLHSSMAVRQAKRAGTELELYAGPTESESPRHLALITELRGAIEEEQFELRYQPQVDLATGTVSGVEALVRWRHPERGLVPPGEFIGVAEQTGLINPLTYIVLGSALRQCAEWYATGFAMPVAVNVSVNSFGDAGFLERVDEQLRAWDVRPKLLRLEITESTLMNEPARTHDLLSQLEKMGVDVSIDDFGTGYSSLSYVASLPIHALKIDRSFVSRMIESNRTRSVIAATISLARSLGIRTVAEGVEDRDQAETLIGMGCTEIQGFYFSRPVDPGALRHWTEEFSLKAYGLCPGTG